MKIKSLSTITLVVLLAHCTIGIKFNSHKFTVSEVSSFSEDTWKEKFEAFITKYDKKYDTEEEYNKRFNAYKINFLESAKNNDEQPYAIYGENSMFDYTKDDWKSLVMPARPPPSNVDQPRMDAYSRYGSKSFKKRTPKNKRETVPSSFNWCDDSRYCTPVKHQRSCGGCWAFAATSAIETHWAIRKGKLYNLSQQFLIDCGYAFRDTREIPYYDDYPYLGYASGECKTNFASEVSLFGGYETIPKNLTFEELAEEIYKNGPVAFEAYSGTEFDYYQGGIITCATEYTYTNHNMLIVGYGIESGMKYVVVRNSWGDSWGDKGYAKLKFGDCASRSSVYTRPILKPDEWTCHSNRKGICDCNCGLYDPDCDIFFNFTTFKDERNPSTCNEGTICSPLTAKCEKWTCDPFLYNAGYDCNCGCGSWDPDCEKHETYQYVIGCNKSNKEICSRVDGSCVAGWTCKMSEYGVPGKCHCGCGLYDPGCLNCSSELINCPERPECKEESSSEQKTGTSSIYKSEHGTEGSESGGSAKPGHKDGAISLAGFGFMLILITILFM